MTQISPLWTFDHYGCGIQLYWDATSIMSLKFVCVLLSEINNVI